MRSKLRQERGISAVIAVVSLLGLFGAALLSLDAGNMWQTRRNIIQGTDATALDQAINLAKTGATSCNGTWDVILKANSPGATPVSCTYNVDPTVPGVGWIGVEATKEAETRFGGLFGLGNTHPYSFSAAQIYYPEGVKGLRPIGLCIDNDHVREWLNSLAPPDGTGAALPAPGSTGHPVYAGAGLVHHITWNKDADGECGSSTAGNWGWQDYDGGNNSADTLAKWILGGYDGIVNAPGDCDNDGTGPDPAGGAGDNCPGDPGAQGGNNNNCNPSTVAGSLACIKSTSGSIKEFPIILYTSGVCTTGGGGGGGNTCSYVLARIQFVRLWNFEISGAEQNRYFDLEFVNGQATGPCCDPTPEQTDIKAVRICSVDHDSRTETERCTSG